MEISADTNRVGRWRGPVDPDVTVVVATRNRSGRLRRCLDALAAQEVRASQVVVVDDASTDDTASVLQEVCSEFGANIRVIRRGQSGGPGGARNSGWETAETPYIAFTDDDCEPVAGWLREAMSTARANPGCIVQGPTLPIPSESDDVSPVSRTLEVTRLGPWFPMSNMTYPAEALRAVGGFDSSLERGEDTDLAWRVQAAGYGAVWSAQALVHHAVMRLGFAGTLRLAWAWSPVVSVIAAHPHLRSELDFGLFWKRSHALLALALGGLVFGRRYGRVLFALPFAFHMRPAKGARARAYAWLPFLALKEGAEVAGLVWGSIRARFPVL